MISPCPTRNELEAFARSQVSDKQFEMIAEHLGICTKCEEIVAQVEEPMLRAVRLLPQLAALADEPQCRQAVDTVRNLICREPAETGIRPPSAYPLVDSDSLPGFRILRQLGSGGMGRVYLAEDEHLGRLVAIKVLVPQSEQQFGPRFRREMASLARIDHPHVVRAHQAGSTEDGPFLVMEYVDGTDVGTLCRSVGPLRVPDSCEIARQAALGLQALHERGLVHRDIKPHNMMLTADGVVKIVDFGLARGDADAVMDMTATGDVLGSAEYVAPEQVRDGREVDIRADIYSLGCTIFRMLAGTPPYDRAKYDSVLKMLRAHEEAPIPLVRNKRPDVPKELAKIVTKMLAKYPDQRYETPAEVCAAIHPFAHGNDLRRLVRAVPVVDKSGSAVTSQRSMAPSANLQRIASDIRLAPNAAPRAPQSGLRRIGQLLLCAAVLLAILITAAQIILRIRHPDGTRNTFEIPRGSEVTITPKGEVDVRLSGVADAPISGSQVDDAPVLERIIDDGDRGYSEIGDGWTTGSRSGGYGDDYRHNNKGAFSARWEFLDLPPDKYEVFITWVTMPGDVSKQRTTLFDGETRLKWTYVAMNREPRDELAHGHRWQRLGIYDISNGVLAVEIDCRVSHGGTCADAVRIVRFEEDSGNRKSNAIRFQAKSGRSHIASQRPTLSTNEWIIDDGDRGYSEEGDGWQTGTLDGGFDGDYRVLNKDSISARWTLGSLPPGIYEVFITWLPGPSYTRVHTSVYDGDSRLKSTFVAMNRQPRDKQAHAHWWQRLGEYQINSGELAVEVDCQRSHGGCIADAVRVVQLRKESGQVNTKPSGEERSK